MISLVLYPVNLQVAMPVNYKDRIKQAKNPSNHMRRAVRSVKTNSTRTSDYDVNRV